MNPPGRRSVESHPERWLAHARSDLALARLGLHQDVLIDRSLIPALQATLQLSDRADFCVGYFNLRGWRRIDEHIERWSRYPGCCGRFWAGMRRFPEDERREVLRIVREPGGIDNQVSRASFSSSRCLRAELLV